MNDPRKFGTEFASDHALEQRTPIDLARFPEARFWTKCRPSQTGKLNDRLSFRLHRVQTGNMA